MTLTDQTKIKNAKRLIIVLAVIIPLVVATLFKVKIDGYDFTFLPSIYAGINGLTAIVLVTSLFAIKNKKIQLHRSLMRFALLLSVCFLLLYVLYHMTTDSTLYGDLNHDNKIDILERIEMGSIAYFYYILLILHVFLSVAVIPIVLFTYLFAWQGDFEKHKRWTKFAFPIWLFVAISGVIVFFMISKYYK